MWQQAMARKAGADVVATTLSQHARYAPAGTVRKSLFMRVLADWPRPIVRIVTAGIPGMRSVTHALCSFPPARLLALAKLPDKTKIVVNAGHRIHIHLERDALVDFTRTFAALGDNSRFRLAAMSEYDFHYIRYYTGLEVLRLPVVAEHAPAALRDRAYSPTNRTVLIGPSHNTEELFGIATLDALNLRSADTARSLGVDPYRFEFIKTVYPRDTSTLENIAQHPAVVMMPYSAFSISMVEIYQLNIPFFVPADHLLIGKMDDVRLAPIYQDAAAVERLDREFRDAGRARGYPYSPNDPSPEAQKFWMSHMYFNQVENAVRFDTVDDLLAKLYGLDLADVSSRMRAENRRLASNQLDAWRSFLSS